MLNLKSFGTIVLILAGVFLSPCLSAYGQMHPVEKNSTIKFTIKNFGFRVSGSFGPPTGDIRFNPDSLSSAYFHITVKSTSVNTDNESRDNHIREADYLDVEHHPVIKFTSDQVRALNKSETFEVVGKLTIKNKTQQITIPFKAQKSGQEYIFTGAVKIKRKDFEVGGSSTISDELTVDLQVVAQ